MQTDFEIPRRVAICPVCNGALSLDVNEWLSESGAPTEEGCYIDCDKHCILSYDAGLSLAHHVYLWAKDHIRVTETKEELLQRKADFEAGKPLPGGMR